MSTSTSRDIAQPGLGWETGLFSTKPIWTTKPSVAVIKRLAGKHLKASEADVEVKFFAQGAFNKLYAVTCGDKGHFIFRVTLPVAPNVKTASEVATLAFVQENTTIPVPKVIAYDADLTNELGFEWILMERMNGRSLHEKWHEMSWLKKGLLVQQVAGFTAQLARMQLSGIGSIYHAEAATDADGESVDIQSYRLGEAVRPTFFLESHIQLPIARGPFTNSEAFVSAHMQHLQHDIATQLQSDDEDEQEDAEEMQEVYIELESIIPQLLPPRATKEPSMLYHPDLSANNILVNDEGDLVGIVDWESVIAAPAWLSCQLPEFLQGPSRSILSCPEALPEEFQHDAAAVEVNQEQLYGYEKAQLRRFFLEEMARVEPHWAETFRTESTRRDVLVAIELVAMGLRTNTVKGWAEAVGEGRVPKVSLTDAIRSRE
jgi:aminoglycoside phosphotransferase (APT) family kinase protein